MQDRDLIVVCGEIASGKTAACKSVAETTVYEHLSLDRLAVVARRTDPRLRAEIKSWCIKHRMSYDDVLGDFEPFYFANIVFSKYQQDSGFPLLREYEDLQRPYLQFYLDQLLAATPYAIVELALPPIVSGLRLPQHRGFIACADLTPAERIQKACARGGALTESLVAGVLAYQEQGFAWYRSLLGGMRGYYVVHSYNGEAWLDAKQWRSELAVNS